MTHIQAVVVDPTVSGRLALSPVAYPLALPHETLVRVTAISLNRGEVRRALNAEAGWRPGWDFAGVVETTAARGTQLAPGTRVVGYMPSGAWAEVVAVPTNAIAPLPDSVSFAAASTLPIAGLTALLGLERGGLLLGKTVLITGASGGVGYLACQLARQAGAKVVAQVRRLESKPFVQMAGVDEIVVEDEMPEAAQHGPYDLILDSTAGKTLTTALGLLAKDGECVIFGTTAGPEISFNVQQFYGKGSLKIYGFIIFHELEKRSIALELSRLARLVEQQKLIPHIEVEAPWTKIAEVAQQLTDRQFMGKAVLHLTA